MTEDQARKLAQRCIDSWPSGPKAYIWRDVLLDLDADYAAVAYRTLVRSAERAPNTGQFMTHYRAVQPPPALPGWAPPANAITLEEYLCRLAERSARGDEAATIELERWQRHGAGRRTGT